ncbi:TetR/AcrR family transcriptional regulator [Longimicrobium sp.]|uniref:TetR/AcrR family transcriptional regulator n=1 Tax=Longimicrobium sp. TaxID=2029185 RepID=UPI002E34093B|nr:TetR/AcrR family transcriptional regulator [Longimicrobium sp.]HEX6036744.1 TetR/AcrR family transcriptional regulator [Longimicrobium sp.]
MPMRQKAGRAMAQERDGDTETRILDAAHAVFMRKGAYGARMQEIADEAGVNRALLHYYFHDREGLARAVFERAMEEMFPAAMRVWAADAPFEQNLREAVRLAFDHLGANPYLPGFLQTEMHVHPERFREMMARVADGPLAAISAQIRAAIDAGHLRPVPLDQLLVSIHALIVFPFSARAFTETVLAESGRDFDDFIAERKETVAEFILRALRP